MVNLSAIGLVVAVGYSILSVTWPVGTDRLIHQLITPGLIALPTCILMALRALEETKH